MCQQTFCICFICTYDNFWWQRHPTLCYTTLQQFITIKCDNIFSTIFVLQQWHSRDDTFGVWSIFCFCYRLKNTTSMHLSQIHPKQSMHKQVPLIHSKPVLCGQLQIKFFHRDISRFWNIPTTKNQLLFQFWTDQSTSMWIVCLVFACILIVLIQCVPWQEVLHQRIFIPHLESWRIITVGGSLSFGKFEICSMNWAIFHLYYDCLSPWKMKNLWWFASNNIDVTSVLARVVCNNIDAWSVPATDASNISHDVTKKNCQEMCHSSLCDFQFRRKLPYHF